ncbi:hypothetical protein [Burkholderia sp. AU15512]|uniref:hypothetical protein n=1 Tax=Burkholderia sp. AU15512 TaxID=2015345 RepID=UPI00211B22AF|nr:hypothetical protein [Burkholderia sp. AU15512]
MSIVAATPPSVGPSCRCSRASWASRPTASRQRCHAKVSKCEASAPDLVGTSDEILERLLADPVVGQMRELRVELPYNLPFENYLQLLDDVITHIAPARGWRPADRREPVAA